MFNFPAVPHDKGLSMDGNVVKVYLSTAGWKKPEQFT